MSCSGVGNIRIEPVNLTWEIEEQTEVLTVADDSESLDGTWFGLQGSDGTKYYVWYDIGAAADPAPAGRTAIPVVVAADATAAAVATATAAALNAFGGGLIFEATADDDHLLITNIGTNDVESTFDGTAPTGFTFTQCQQGGFLDLGLLDGNVETTFEQALLEIKTHQTGSSILAELRQGTSAEIAVVMKETDIPRLKEVFATIQGGKFTPPGGSEGFGWGTVLQGQNTIVQARRLVFHGVNAGADRTRDLCFWKAYPMPETLVYSGEEPNSVSATFKTYIDTDKDSKINHFFYGEWDKLIPGA